MKLRALLALFFAAPALLSAQIEPMGGDLQVNLYTTFPQSSPKVSRAPDGRFVVVWASAYQDGTVSGVYGRVFAVDGTPVTGEIQLSEHTASHPIDPAVAMMDDGSFVAVWENRTDGTGPIYSGIEGRRFAADGTPLGGDFVVHPLNPTKGSHRPVIATNGRGGFVVAWEEGSFDTDVFARIFGPGGQPLAPSFQVNQGETYAVQDQPSVAMGPAGEVVIVWRSNDTFVGFHEEGNQVVYLQRFKADGTRREGEIALSERARRPVYAPRVAKDAAGNFLVVWTEYVSSVATVYGRRFAQNGRPLGGRLTLLREVVPEAIAMDDHGSFVLVWTRPGEDRALDVFARRFSAFGAPEGPEVRVNAHAPRMQYTPIVAAGPGGSFVAAWSSDQQDGDNLGVFARLFEVPEAPGDADLFLLEDRFRVTATWRDFRGRSGVGRATPLTANTGGGPLVLRLRQPGADGQDPRRAALQRPFLDFLRSAEQRGVRADGARHHDRRVPVVLQPAAPLRQPWRHPGVAERPSFPDGRLGGRESSAGAGRFRPSDLRGLRRSGRGPLPERAFPGGGDLEGLSGQHGDRPRPSADR
ncbi:MAG TPA: hypothetical protein VF756_01910 [Thermoanaerobaculia bacterium]